MTGGQVRFEYVQDPLPPPTSAMDLGLTRSASTASGFEVGGIECCAAYSD